MDSKQIKQESIELLGEDIYNQLIESKEVTLKEIRCIAEYLTNGFNKTMAYLKTFYDNDLKKYDCSRTLGSRLFAKVNIKKVIDKLNNNWLKDKKDELENRIINRLEKKAFYDPSIFFTKHGLPAFEDIKDLPEDLRHGIKSIKTKFIGISKKPSLEIELADQDKALDKLAKYMTLFKSDIEINNINIDPDKIKKLESIFGKREKKVINDSKKK
jgi:hypothetical protein